VESRACLQLGCFLASWCWYWWYVWRWKPVF